MNAMKIPFVGVEAIAAACYEANRAYCKYALGDESHLPWEETPQELRASVLSGVLGILEGKTPEESHEAWCAYRKERGWTYGPLKDIEKKTHPCLVPYEDLPESQKRKDHLFSSVVLAFCEDLEKSAPKGKSS